MKTGKYLSLAALTMLLLAGCAGPAKKDYSAFHEANPKTILILPPKSRSPDVKATYGVYSQVQRPVAESGFYVLPVTLVDEHFKANGLPIPDEIHSVDVAKLREVFGADAALYIDIQDYGTKYFVIGSASVVTAQGRMVDLRTGKELWTGTATANSDEGNSSNQMGLAGLLIEALVKQVLATATDQSYLIAGIAADRLLSEKSRTGLPSGPRSPAYKP